MTRLGSAPAVSAACYAVITAFFARDLVWNLAGGVAGDQGDPLFVAALLHWNATTIPLTDGWWQFPIFEPTRDTLAFSEHVLGLSPLATPLHWMTGDAVITYNLVTLLTFPLCGLAMFALAYRLTRSSAAAFLAGLAFAFAPYRISHLPHLQMLAFFWAPLAILGLHAYIESGRRRWLVLYGAAWMLQGATNGYALVFLSVFVAFWVLWFVVTRGNWRALAAIAATTLAAALPLAPIVAKYVSVHGLHGFERDLAEMRFYSADLSAVLCAPPRLTFWGWLRIGCRPEGELFPGIAAAAACLLVLVRVSSSDSAAGTRSKNPVTVIGRVMLVVGLTAAAVAVSVTIAGPWVLALGPLRLSASSIAKPVMLATMTLLLAVALSPGIRAAARQSSTPGFYLVATLLAWVLALGPTLTFMGEPRGFQAPFALLTYLPGVSGLRVPARFWLLTTMCLAVLVALVAAPLLERRHRSASRAVVILGAALILMDGWIARIPVAPVTNGVADAQVLRSATVLTLPMDSLGDIAAGFRAVTGGWRSVNGYSGYFPGYYVALLDAARAEEDDAVIPFLTRGDLHVVIANDATGLRTMIERQPGVVVTAQSPDAVQYRIPRRPAPPRFADAGLRLRIEDVRGSCAGSDARNVVDGDEGTRWHCGPQRPGQELLVDLGRQVTVESVVQNLGAYNALYPRHLVLETSTDGVRWNSAWDGSVRRLLIAQAIERPAPSVRIAVPLGTREARYVRLRQMATDQDVPWSIAELEVRGIP